MTNQTTNDASANGMPDQIEHAFAARESSMYSYALMEGMVTQTLMPHTGLPGVREVLAAGIAPLTSPQKCPFAVHRFRAHRTNAVMFAHANSVYLYSLGTASQVNTPDGDNAWMRTLCEFIRQFRPKNLYVANFNRLIRSALFSGELMKAIEGTGTVLWANGIRIDLGDSQGRVLWQTLAMLSDLERESIVQRLFAGTVNKHQRGEWILTREAVLPGYALHKGRLVLDPSQIDTVRMLIGLLADANLSARRVVDEAGALGLSSPTIRRTHGPGATYASVKRADSKVRSLTSYANAWRTGRLEVRLPNPYRGATHIGSLPVLNPDPPKHWGHVVFTYDLELPDGGWAAPEVLAAVEARRDARRVALGRTGASDANGNRKNRPLSGWARTTDEAGHRLFLSGDNAHYLLMRLDGDPTP